MKNETAETSDPHRVLIVDDDRMIRDLIETILSVKGYRCEQASTGKEALEKVGRFDFDAAVVDVVMPGMDGITLTKELLKRCPDLPVMIMTGYSQMNYMKVPINEAAFAAGAAEFVDKPFAVNEFSIRFHKLVVNHRALMQAKARQREIERTSSQLIAEMQKESGQKIDTLQREIVELKDKLTRLESEGAANGRGAESAKVNPPEKKRQPSEEVGDDLVKALERKLSVIKKNRQAGS